MKEVHDIGGSRLKIRSELSCEWRVIVIHGPFGLMEEATYGDAFVNIAVRECTAGRAALRGETGEHRDVVASPAQLPRGLEREDLRTCQEFREELVDAKENVERH